MQKEFETGLATMCLERGREGGVCASSFFFHVNFGSCPSASGVVSKHQRGARTRRRQTPKTLRPVIIQFQSFQFSSVTSDWLIPLSASSVSSSVSPLPYGKRLPLAIWPLDSGQIASPVGVCVDVRHPLVDRQMSRIWLNTVDTEFLDFVQGNVAKSQISLKAVRENINFTHIFKVKIQT